jgi:hypothetical protein
MKHIEDIVESIIEDVYFQKLDELPFAVNHNNREHATEIVGAMVKIMKQDLREALTTHSAHLVERIEALRKEKQDDPWHEYLPEACGCEACKRTDGFNQALDQAIDIVKKEI